MSADLKAILGKRIKGVLVKKNVQDRGSPGAQFFLVFDDDEILEVYSRTGLGFSDNLPAGGMEKARGYINEPHGPMHIILDVFMNEDGGIETRVSESHYY
jgi:hypothetical protein